MTKRIYSPLFLSVAGTVLAGLIIWVGPQLMALNAWASDINRIEQKQQENGRELVEVKRLILGQQLIAVSQEIYQLERLRDGHDPTWTDRDARHLVNLEAQLDEIQHELDDLQ